MPSSALARNDPRQYDDLQDEWWNPDGSFAMLHWLAVARADLIPPARASDCTLVDVGCGGGLMAEYVAAKGYHHIGVDITRSALEHARTHGVRAVQASASCLPFADATADVVCAGEILEHVEDTETTVSELCRVLRHGGVLVLDTIADTQVARFVTITIGERVPGGAPKGIHDHHLFVNRKHLVELCASHGVTLELNGIRPSLRSMISWRFGKASSGRMVKTQPTSVLFQGCGAKR